MKPTKVKLARNVPEPPAVTELVRERLVEEAAEGRAELAGKVTAIERLTPEDLRVRVA